MVSGVTRLRRRSLLPNRSARSRSDRSSAFEAFIVQSRDERVRDFAVADAERVRQIREHRLRTQPGAFERLCHRCGRGSSSSPASAPIESADVGRQRLRIQTDILELRVARNARSIGASDWHPSPPRRLTTSSVFTRPSTARSCCSRDSGTNTARTSPCCASSANSPRRLGRDDPAHRQSQRAADLVPPAVQRLERNVRRTLDPHQDHAVLRQRRSAWPAPDSRRRRGLMDR